MILKMLAMMALLTANVFAADKVVEELKLENQQLRQRIETNNQFIQQRIGTSTTVSSKIEKPVRKKTVTLSAGFETFQHTYDTIAVSGEGYMASLEREFDNFSIDGSIARILDNDYTGYDDRIEIISSRLNIKRTFTEYKRFKAQGFLGLVNYRVSSIDLGIYEENTGFYTDADLKDSIESASGIDAGLDLTFAFNNRFQTAFRVSAIKRSLGLSLGIKI